MVGSNLRQVMWRLRWARLAIHGEYAYDRLCCSGKMLGRHRSHNYHEE